MGLGGLHIWHLLILLVIVLLLFGTKKIKNIGADLGDAVKGFRSAMSSGDKAADEPAQIGNDAAAGTAKPTATAAPGTASPTDRPKA